MRSIVCSVIKTLAFHSASIPLTPTCLGRKLHQTSGLLALPWFQSVKCLHNLSDLHILTDSSFLAITRARPTRQRFRKGGHKKRKFFRPKGPFAWVNYTPGQPILPKTPNEGCRRRYGNQWKTWNKRLAQRTAHINKLKWQRRLGRMKGRVRAVDRKIAAAARANAWAEKLAKLQKMERESGMK